MMRDWMCEFENVGSSWIFSRVTHDTYLLATAFRAAAVADIMYLLCRVASIHT